MHTDRFPDNPVQGRGDFASDARQECQTSLLLVIVAEIMAEVKIKGGRMRPRLRLFIGADEHDSTAVSEPEVSISLEELTRVLADAIIWDRTWLQDFAGEDVRISSDLFEVLSTYSHLRPSA